MRTTITLEPDVAAKLKELAHRRRASFKDTVNEVLRKGLTSQSAGKPPKPFKVKAHAGGFRPGIDPDKLNQLLDELEVDERVARAARRSDRSRRQPADLRVQS